MNKITMRLILKKGKAKPIHNHHPWIFSGAIARINGNPQPGDLVHVADNKENYLATGYYNPNSQIRARILSWDESERIDDGFWRRKIERAIAGRQELIADPATTAYRLINAEADGLPGLIVDRYADFLVMQCLTLGIDSRKELLSGFLQDMLTPKGIVERSDVTGRKTEGLSQKTGLLWGESPPETVSVLENGLTFGVNTTKGHKTGFYLDQRNNRTAVTHPALIAEKEILNVFAYTGGFAVYAAANNAAKIINIDSSIPVLEQAEKNIIANGFQRPQDEYIAGDAFEVLRHYRDTNRQFDMVILDPPKFAHTQRDIERASRGYKDLNWLGLRLLKPGGTLATFSCSGRISPDLFQKIVFGAAVDAERDVQIIQTLGQASDHPILLSFPESAYLNGLLCRVW